MVASLKNSARGSGLNEDMHASSGVKRCAQILRVMKFLHGEDASPLTGWWTVDRGPSPPASQLPSGHDMIHRRVSFLSIEQMEPHSRSHCPPSRQQTGPPRQLPSHDLLYAVPHGANVTRPRPRPRPRPAFVCRSEQLNNCPDPGLWILPCCAVWPTY